MESAAHRRTSVDIGGHPRTSAVSGSYRQSPAVIKKTSNKLENFFIDFLGIYMAPRRARSKIYVDTTLSSGR